MFSSISCYVCINLNFELNFVYGIWVELAGKRDKNPAHPRQKGFVIAMTVSRFSISIFCIYGRFSSRGGLLSWVKRKFLYCEVSMCDLCRRGRCCCFLGSVHCSSFWKGRNKDSQSVSQSVRLSVLNVWSPKKPIENYFLTLWINDHWYVCWFRDRNFVYLLLDVCLSIWGLYCCYGALPRSLSPSQVQWCRLFIAVLRRQRQALATYWVPG